MSAHSRRDVLRRATASVGLALSATAIANIVAGCEQDETTPTEPTGKSFTVDIAAIPALGAVGGISLTLVSGLNSDEPVFISRIDQTTFAVFTSICTHQGCPIELPVDAQSNCVCPCHRAEFSRRDGSVVRQPTSGSATNLQRYASTFDAQTTTLTIRT